MTQPPARRPFPDVRLEPRKADFAFEFGQEVGGPPPPAIGREPLPDGAEEARRFAAFARRRRETPAP